MSRLIEKIGLLGVTCLAVLGLSNAMAGGLVDTDADAFAAADFDENSDVITNRWWTLEAGSNFLYFAETEDGCAWNLVEVLEETTANFEGIYAGTKARIVLDREWVDEECELESWEDVLEAIEADELEAEEATYDWYAQDLQLNIWYMGEDTWDGESSEGSFIAGCDGAEAGIVVLGDPFKGAFYRQERYEDQAEDWGKVLNLIPVDDLECMKTKEWTPLERGHIEHKFYCTDGVYGELVLINELKGKTVVVELIDTNVEAPEPPDAPPSPIPNCED